MDYPDSIRTTRKNNTPLFLRNDVEAEEPLHGRMALRRDALELQRCLCAVKYGIV